MKGIVIVVAAVVFAPLAALAAPGMRLNLDLSLFDMTPRLGVEVPLTNDFAVRAEAGPSLFSLEGSFVLAYRFGDVSAPTVQ